MSGTLPSHEERVNVRSRHQYRVRVRPAGRGRPSPLSHAAFWGNLLDLPDRVERVESSGARRFGDLSVERNKRRLLAAWHESKLFTLSGLDRESIAKKVMSECRNGGDFLRIVMSEIARKQGVQRWADTPLEHLLYLERIKETIPDALIIHIIRDGRDVALSTDKQGYIRRRPWTALPRKWLQGFTGTGW